MSIVGKICPSNVCCHSSQMLLNFGKTLVIHVGSTMIYLSIYLYCANLWPLYVVSYTKESSVYYKLQTKVISKLYTNQWNFFGTMLRIRLICNDLFTSFM